MNPMARCDEGSLSYDGKRGVWIGRYWAPKKPIGRARRQVSDKDKKVCQRKLAEAHNGAQPKDAEETQEPDQAPPAPERCVYGPWWDGVEWLCLCPTGEPGESDSFDNIEQYYWDSKWHCEPEDWHPRYGAGRELLRLASENKALREAMRPCLIALMSEISEEMWSAEWMENLENRLIEGIPSATAEQRDFDSAALALGEVPSYVTDSEEEEYVWRPLTDEERQKIQERLMGWNQ